MVWELGIVEPKMRVEYYYGSPMTIPDFGSCTLCNGSFLEPHLWVLVLVLCWATFDPCVPPTKSTIQFLWFSSRFLGFRHCVDSICLGYLSKG